MNVTPSTHYHPLPVKLINRVRRVLNSLGVGKIELTENALLATARRETGLDRFGDESFLPALHVLLHALDTEARLNPFGQVFARANIVRFLKNRLWANACFEVHPEILQREIVAPIVVVGPARSGTTRLHRMLAEDSRLMHLKTWEGLNPAPRTGLPDAGRRARRSEVEKSLALRQRLNPGAFVAHPMATDWPEEEILLLNHSFCSMSVLGFYNIPGYYDWFLHYDRTAAYRYMADLMKLISWSRGDAETKRWVLKTPQHMLDIDVLLKIFPDAKLVFTHRDPLKTVASTLSLAWHFAVQNTDGPLHASIKTVWLDLCEQMARRCIDGRQAVPAAQQLDVYYHEMNHNWRTVMRRIYQFAGIDFTPALEQTLDEWLSRSKAENQHGGHRYSLEDFGTTSDEVDARMKFYRDQYAIPYENP